MTDELLDRYAAARAELYARFLPQRDGHAHHTAHSSVPTDVVCAGEAWTVPPLGDGYDTLVIVHPDAAAMSARTMELLLDKNRSWRAGDLADALGAPVYRAKYADGVEACPDGGLVRVHAWCARSHRDVMLYLDASLRATVAPTPAWAEREGRRKEAERLRVLASELDR